MDGPSFHCAYLNFSAVSKPPTNLNAIQSPIKELYLQFRKSSTTGRSANLKLIQKGVLVTLFENGLVKAELFIDFSSVTFVEAVRFLPIKRDRKHRAIFVPLDESKVAISDKHVFTLDKSYHFLTSAAHPPLVVCVVRRPTGVKALDCHVFALDTIENALHIAALIASTQMPVGQMTRMDSAGDVSRVSFDRGVRGDVVRTDLGEFSVYKGAPSYDPPMSHRYSGGPTPELQPVQRYDGGPVQGPGRNMGYPAMQGPILLTQDNFREPPSQHQQQPYGGGPPPKVYGMPDPMLHGGPHGQGYPRPPDVIMNTRQTSVESIEYQPQDRGVGDPDPSFGALRMHYDDVNMRNNKNRVSGVVVTESRISGAPNESRFSGVPNDGPTYRHSADPLPPGGRHGPHSSDTGHVGGFQRHSDHIPSHVPPSGVIHSTRNAAVTSPTNPRGQNLSLEGGPVFSASNLESRGQVVSSQPEERRVGGRPVAKVPPHTKGIKVLPSDFRMVKLKPKVDKRSDSFDEGYDNDKELLHKYRALQEYEKETNYGGGLKQAGTSLQDTGFRDFSDVGKMRSDERSRDFLSQWNETVRDTAGGHANESTTDFHRYGDEADYTHHQEDGRYDVPSYSRESGDAWGQRPQSGAHQQVPVKELEIANMFSNMKVHPGNSRQMYRPTGDRNEIEDGLGYLP
ncbi:hypothetical protein BsWGS_21641 [Bradybaena similaris]